MPTSSRFSGKIGASGGPDAGSNASMDPNSLMPTCPLTSRQTISVSLAQTEHRHWWRIHLPGGQGVTGRSEADGEGHELSTGLPEETSAPCHFDPSPRLP